MLEQLNSEVKYLKAHATEQNFIDNRKASQKIPVAVVAAWVLKTLSLLGEQST